jgi:hypothetical protein
VEEEEVVVEKEKTVKGEKEKTVKIAFPPVSSEVLITRGERCHALGGG